MGLRGGGRGLKGGGGGAGLFKGFPMTQRPDWDNNMEEKGGEDRKGQHGEGREGLKGSMEEIGKREKRREGDN